MAVQPEPLEAPLDRPEDAVPAEVELPAMGGGHGEAVVVLQVGVLRRRHQAPADLGREQVRVAGKLAQRGPEPALGEPEPVVRRGVEVPHAAVPRGRRSPQRCRRRSSRGTGCRTARCRDRARSSPADARSVACGWPTSSKNRIHRTSYEFAAIRYPAPQGRTCDVCCFRAAPRTNRQGR